jgi:hypothetical protein
MKRKDKLIEQKRGREGVWSSLPFPVLLYSSTLPPGLFHKVHHAIEAKV